MCRLLHGLVGLETSYIYQYKQQPAGKQPCCCSFTLLCSGAPGFFKILKTMSHTVALETYTQSIQCKTKGSNHNENILFKFYQATKYIGCIIYRTTQEQQIHIRPEKRKCGGFGQEVDFFGGGGVFASKYFLTIQKDQLDHTARTGNRCRMGANIAQRELKTAYLKVSFYIWVTCAHQQKILPNVLLPQHAVPHYCVPNGIQQLTIIQLLHSC